MAVTENTYTGNGSTVLFSFTFPYLETTDIKVSLNGVNTTAYTLANATTVQFNTAPANGAAIRIYRATADATTKATFFPGSSIRAQDLNDNFTQGIYIAQETANFAAATDASAIQATANTALANSNTAITTANAASATANGIAATANTALSNSTAAVSTANTANSNATSALSIANAALPKAGGTMTGNIIFNAGQTFPDVLPLTGGTLTGNLTLPSINGGPIAGTRNRIINGGMRIDQRNAGAAQNSLGGGSSVYLVDRWKYYADQAGKFNSQQNAGLITPPAGFTNYLGLTSTSAYTSLAADQFGLIQSIEGFNAADLNYGTASAVTCTLSFWVRSSLTGTHSGSIKNSAGDRSYPFSFTVSAANTWEQKSVTFAGDTSGTWLTNNGQGLNVNFNLGSGSNTLGTAGAWTGSNRNGVTGAVSVVATNGATFYITGVQLEPGTVATPFERRSYGQELALCQRYFEAKTHLSTGAKYANTGGTWFAADLQYVSKRVTPTIAITASVLSGSFSPTVGNVNSDCAAVGVSTTGATQYTTSSITFTASAEL